MNLFRKKNILFVCTGNTCRSPMAERLAKKNAGIWRFFYRFQSAGISTKDGQPASKNAVTVMEKDFRINLSDHKSRNLTKEMITQADKIFTMSQSHLSRVLELSPEAKDKTRLLNPAGITDPHGYDEDRYRKTANDLLTAIKNV